MTPIATATNTAGPPIPVGDYPLAIAITPDGKTAYVANCGLGHGDPDHDRHQHRRPADPGRRRSHAIAITPDGKTAYVANDDSSGTVTPITTATNTAGAPIPVGDYPVCHRDHAGRQDRLRRQPRLGHGDPDHDRHQHRRTADHDRRPPRAIAITPDGKTAYVANTYAGTVTPITTATNTAGPPITAGNDPLAIAITPDGKTAYVGNVGSGTGDPDRDRHQHRRPADHRRHGPMPSRSRRSPSPGGPPSPAARCHGCLRGARSPSR